MRARTTTAAVAGFLAASASAQNSTATCATGVHLIVARGSNEAPGSGRIGSVANGVVAAVPGSQIAPIDYPASFDNYSSSVAIGTEAVKTALTLYNSRCPNSKVALLGFSQGAHVAGDALCGNTEDDESDQLDLEFSDTTPLPASIVDQSVIAVILFGDPTHNATAPWNRGTSTRNGLFPRENITACEAYASKIESYCDTGDIYCDIGNNTSVHGSYFGNYTDDAVEFIAAQFNASKNSANGTAPTATPTTVPGSGAAASAPGMLMSLVGLSVFAAYLL
ncbi:acetylxylan esterase 2 [Colletotrichum tofieldiae]|uniref:Acetylxylan esterase 2 (Cutinase) n=1 Tax=Colletotrichum tofieldiae TaxID=708197 RepID=A0A166R2R0_9PEZI|nr:acetylxylan esterase 2 (cutinase) [Colletotrichum tofieldiae]GKT54540.1 acetylxylan esterase 2 [Colletotrichum tofieldiae]GKT81251.1 acetylxylan esterase 2 [Colletotrichum tofieldiae]